MASTTLQKRTSTPGAVPTIAQLLDGQWAFNIYDGKAFLVRNQSGTRTVLSFSDDSKVFLKTDTVPVTAGGTGATTASSARSNLGLGSISTQDANNVSITGGSISGVTFSAAALTLNQAGSATVPQLDLQGTTNNWVRWSNVGVAAPAFTTRSAGTKLVLWSGATGTTVDYAIGVESGHQWTSVPANSTTQGFKWYGGTTRLMSLEGGSVGLNVVGPIECDTNLTVPGTSAGRAEFGVIFSTGGASMRGYGAAPLVDIDPMPDTGTADAFTRMFRFTTTTGLVQLRIHSADGTASLNSALGANGTSYLNAVTGNVLIGKSTDDATNKLQVSGSIMSDSNIIAGNADPFPKAQGRNTHFVSHSTGSQAGYSCTRWSNDTVGPQIFLMKSRGATIGANGILVNNDDVGYITWAGNDGTDNVTTAAQITGEIAGTPASNVMPGRLRFYTGNAAGGLGLVLTLDADNSATFTGAVSASGDVTTTGDMQAGNVRQTFFSCFSATNTGQIVSTNTTVTVTLGTEDFDLLGDFSANQFTAQIAGYYQFNAGINLNSEATGLDFWMVAASGTYHGVNTLSGAGTLRGSTVSALVHLNAAQTAILKFRHAAAGASRTIDSAWFNGFLVQAD